MNTENNKKTVLTKKKSIIIISVLAVLLIVLALLNTIDFDKIIKDLFYKNEDPVYNYFFYSPDYETDILSDSEYLELDRTVSYTEGAITYRDAELDNYYGTPVIKDYLEALINGDCEKYKSLFTEEYKSNSKNKIPETFPQQRVYNISVTRIGEPYMYKADDLDGKYTGIIRYVYSVSYMIQYNTGTVRDDIDSESMRPLVIEVFETPDGKLKINAMEITGNR